MRAPIYLILGAPASGKSTVARALLRRCSRGLHLPVDDLRHGVVAGLADLGHPDPAALDQQLRLARATAVSTARRYAREGFTAVIDDFWLEDNPERHYEALRGRAHWVVLRPTVDTMLERLRTRRPEEGSFKDVLAWAIRHLDPLMEAHPKTGMTVIDSSHLSVEQTVECLLEQTGTAPA